MSEINSIAQGTYTLGQTSATTYQAGPGISITQPSEGTVRISNDETVLWEATANNQYSATLREPYSNFERIRIEFNSNDALNTGKSLYNEFPGYVTQFNLIGQRTDVGGIVMTLSDLNGSEDKTQLTPSYGRYVIVSKTSTSLTVGSINIALKSVIGINRISGGNE
jgi:hypothetical protein